MVVFGAGASYDSCLTHPAPGNPNENEEHRDCRLPLGDQLFEERALFHPILQRFPRSLDVASRLRFLLPDTTVEHVMEQLRDEAAKYPRRWEQLAALRYYLQIAIGDGCSEWDRRAAHGVTNYRTLLDMIELRRQQEGGTVCLVTFNYDTMLDEALATVGIEIRSLDSYIESPHYKVIKVHGSISWAREMEPWTDNIDLITEDQLVRELIGRAATLKPTSRFHVAIQRPTTRLGGQRPAIPAIAIPVRTKGEFECPAEHIAALKACLNDVTKLLVIGWAANDTHFLDLLRDGREGIKAWVVAGSEPNANKVIENLKPALRKHGKLHAGPSGFSHFIHSDARVFLDSF